MWERETDVEVHLEVSPFLWYSWKGSRQRVGVN